MSALVHCDGPGCDKTRDPNNHVRRVAQESWIHVETRDYDRDFHNRKCLAAWSAEQVSSVGVVDRLAHQTSVDGR